MKHSPFAFFTPLLAFLLLLATGSQCYAQAPFISTVSPPNGSTAGGTPVTINGSNFTGSTSVTFGGTAVTTFNVINPNQITATTPAHAAGTVTVSVTTPAGTANWTIPGFTYITPPPTVTSVSPSSGSTNGGTSVTITGTSFTGATSVTFGGTPATGISVVNATTITATTPAHAAGQVNVAVTTPGGPGTGSNVFTYVVPAPTVTGVSPSSGPITGGTPVTITGTDFNGGPSVTFGGISAMGVVVTSATTITAFTPAGSVGTADVAVTTSGGTGTGNGLFSYSAIAPSVDSPTATSVTATTATLGGTVGSDGGAAITERGVVYAPTATNSDPQIGGTGVVKSTASGTTGVFTVPVSGLSSGTGYTYRAYAINSAGTGYSVDTTFSTPSTNANLSGLALSVGTLSPAFAAATTSYTADVAYATSSITVTPTVADATATVTVNGVGVASGAASGAISLNVGDNTITTIVTAQDGTSTRTYSVTVYRADVVSLTATAGTTGPTGYASLREAFNAINAGTHQGAITLDIMHDTTETAPAVLNASGSGGANYTSVLVRPSGGAARSISGAITAGSPLVDLNGADNVTFDGLNTGGNALTVINTTASATAGTSTIRLINGATNNTITNCNLQGSVSSAVATVGAVVLFSTDAVTANGNDNNTISNNNIGPAGTSRPTKAIQGAGSTTSTAIGNSGIVISNNNIFDYFGAAVTSSGVATTAGCNTWSITGNRFYQTATRTWTTGANHRAIDIGSITTTSGAQGFTITNNIIGYSSSTQTGTYALTGSVGKFAGIVFDGIDAGTVSNINNNTVAAVSLTGVTTSGTASGTPFFGIFVKNGVTITNNNTIGSQSATGSLTFATNSGTQASVTAIFNFGSDAWTANNNMIGGITASNAGFGAASVNGIRVNTSSSVATTLNANTIGGTVADSIQSTSTDIQTQVAGIYVSSSITTATNNTIRNLTAAGGTGTATAASVVGIDFTNSLSVITASQNTIYNLTNTHATAASVVTGLQFTGATGNVVERNCIHSLKSATTHAGAELNGIRVAGGTTVYRNNMIALGAGTGNAPGAAASNAGTSGINGISEAGGTNSFFHNSVYIGGSPTAGSGASYAFNGTQITETRSFRNNIFFNARSNSGATGKHYAIKLDGTTPNPTGLTLNNNLYLANGTGGVFGYFNSLDVADLAAWQSAVGQDAGSLEGNPQYLAPANATPDLHINAVGSSPAESNGAVLAAVTDDFDGETRSALTPVDIGADAGSFATLDMLTQLASLTTSDGTLSPAFDTTTLAYSAGVPYATTSMTVTPSTDYRSATVTVNGSAVASGTASGVLALNTGNNTISVVVTAQDGVTTKTYTVTVNRAMVAPAATTEATDGITTSSAVLHGTANPYSTSTDVVFEYSDSDPLLQSSPPSVVAASGLTGSTAQAVSASLTSLTPGVTYYYRTVAVSAGGSGYGAIQSFTVAKASQTISFGALANKTYGEAPFNLTATGGGSGQPVTFAVTSGPATISGNTVTLTGAGEVTITASQAGNTNYLAAADVARTFSVLSSDTLLFGLTLSSGSLSPAFSNAVTYYTVNVPYSTGSLTVTPTAVNGTVSVTVNGVPQASGTASPGISLNSGINTITVVASKDGGDTKTYTIVVVRAFAPLPVVTTIAATNLAGSSATLNGTVNPFSSPTSGSFVYSTSPTLQPEVSTLANVGEIVYLTADSIGNVYFCEGTLIRKITSQGVVSVFVGSGTSGSADGTGADAQFDFVYAITTDGADNLYVEDLNHTSIRKITPAGVVTTLPSIAPYTARGLASDTEGNLYFMDGTRIIRRSINGTFHVLAGSTSSGYVDGAGNVARFYQAENLAVDLLGNVYLADSAYHTVRKITPTGVVSTLAGGTGGFADGTGSEAQFNQPVDVSVDAKGNVHVLDKNNFRIRKITPGGVVTTIAGSGVSGSANGTGTAATFTSSFGLAGTLNGDLYCAETGAHKIRAIRSQRVAAQSGLVGDTVQNISANLSGLAVGTTYYYSASATNSGGTADGEILSFSTLTLPEAWQAAHFTSGELLDQQTSGWTASPDNDGLNNLQEFAFGTDPRSAGSGLGSLTYAGGVMTRRGQPVPRTANGTDFHADFARRNNYLAAGLTYTVQFSANLTTWENSVDTPTVVASDSEMDVVTVPFPALLVSGLKPRFFRVLVTLP